MRVGANGNRPSSGGAPYTADRSSVDSALIDYLTAAAQRFSEASFDDADERQLFVHNTFAETSGHEMALCTDSRASRVVEQLLPHVEAAQLSEFVQALGDQLDSLLFHPAGSCVLQRAMTRASACIESRTNKEDIAAAATAEVTDGVLEQFVLRVADCVMSACLARGRANMRLNNPCASHVARTCLLCLAGCGGGDSVEETAKAADNIGGGDSKRSLAFPAVAAVPAEFGVKLSQLVSAIGKHAALAGALSQPAVSLVLQTALRSLTATRRHHACAKLVRRLCRVDFGAAGAGQDDDDGLKASGEASGQASRLVFGHESCQRLLETALLCSAELAQHQPTLFGKLYSRFYSGRVCCLLRSGVAPATSATCATASVQSLSSGCIAVQKLVDACASADVLAAVIGEAGAGCCDRCGSLTSSSSVSQPEDSLTSSSSSLSSSAQWWWWWRSRVPVAMARACVRCSAQQAEFVQLAALQCGCQTPASDTASVTAGDLPPSSLPTHLISCLLYGLTERQWLLHEQNKSRGNINMNSSLLAQTLLEFSGAWRRRVADALLAISPRRLTDLARCQYGSHLIDRLATLPSLGDSRRQRLLTALLAVEGNDDLLVMSRHGSRVLENLWSVCNVAQRCCIAEKLAPHRKQLRGDFNGRFAYDRFALELFVNKRADWLAYVKREANRRRLFADLLDGDESGAGGVNGGKKSRRSDVVSFGRNVESAEVVLSGSVDSASPSPHATSGREIVSKRHTPSSLASVRFESLLSNNPPGVSSNIASSVLAASRGRDSSDPGVGDHQEGKDGTADSSGISDILPILQQVGSRMITQERNHHISQSYDNVRALGSQRNHGRRLSKSLTDVARNIATDMISVALRERLSRNSMPRLPRDSSLSTSSRAASNRADSPNAHDDLYVPMQHNHAPHSRGSPISQLLAPHVRPRRQNTNQDEISGESLAEGFESGSGNLPSISEVVVSTLVDLALQEGRTVADQIASTALSWLTRQLSSNVNADFKRWLLPAAEAVDPATVVTSQPISEHERLQRQLGYARSGRRAALAEVQRLRQQKRQRDLLTKTDWSVERVNLNGDLLAMLWSLF